MTERHGAKVAIIGGSSGIGLATAQLMVSLGAQVFITGRSAQSVDSAVTALGSRSRGAIVDISSSASLCDLAAVIADSSVQLDGLVVTAGINVFASFEKTTREQFDEVMAVDAAGTFFGVQALAPYLKNGAGVVVLTSVARSMALPELAAYGAAKSAVRSLVRGMAREMAPRGIRVNAISPGAIDTGILEKSMPLEAAQGVLASSRQGNPLGRVGAPEEVARAINFLLFDATYTTGAELTVDGGASQM